MRILLFANSDWYLYNYRLALANYLRAQGHEVILLSPSGKYAQKLQTEGFEWHAVEFSRDSLNPFGELIVVWKLHRLLKQIQPDILHNFTLKSVLYGSLAAKHSSVSKVINAITGRGYLFINNNVRANLARMVAIPLLRYALKGSQVIFQNQGDLQFYIEQRFLLKEQTSLIYGSGVDIQKFSPGKYPPEEANIIFPSRLLKDKGVYEFVEAAKIVRSKFPKIKFVLVGTTDKGNPSSLVDKEIIQWQNERLIEWWGWQEDMPWVYHKALLVCLPSYSEGLARSLLEAASCGIPIITTNIPGCREIVQHNKTGFLVPTRDVHALVDSIMVAIDHPNLLVEMGRSGREFIVRHYSQEIVNKETYKLYL